MNKNAKIFIAGHNGMVGSAILRKLTAEGYHNLLLRSRAELDLRSQTGVAAFFAAEKPEYVILAAGRVGGINANMRYKAEFLLENLQIQNNVIWNAYEIGVKKLCFLGSSCIYPHACLQPMKEEYLLSGPLEPTNEGYAIAKVAGHKLCRYLTEQYGFKTISLMPCNLYGTNDNFNLESCHVFSAMIRRFSDAVREGHNEVFLWGTGSAKREFMHVDDLANATINLMDCWDDPDFINVGYGEDITIRQLSEMISFAAGFKGAIKWDSSKPDGMLRKLMDCSKVRRIGIKPKISIEEGIRRTVEEYRALPVAGNR